jgi:hypothetical protein
VIGVGLLAVLLLARMHLRHRTDRGT